MPTKFKLNLPPVFNAARRTAAQSRAVSNTANQTVTDIQNAMETEPHTGKTVTRGGRRHQQSRRGQRPAPFSRTLKRSVRTRKISDHESVITVDAEYTEHLIKLDRVIISEADEKKAAAKLQRNFENELKSLT